MAKVLHLHLIEPTLFDQTGHSYSYNYSLIWANAVTQQFQIELWTDKRATDLLQELPGPCTTRPYFRRAYRQLQKIFLFRRLLKAAMAHSINQQHILYLGTAGFWDLLLLTWLLKKYSTTAVTAVLHFHQFRLSKRKHKFLNKYAYNYPTNLKLVTPTVSLQALFSEFHWPCSVIACPSFPRPPSDNQNIATHCDGLVYAGAARADKGFDELVDLVCYMRSIHYYFPVYLQVSPPHSGQYDESSRLALKRLQSLSANNMILYWNTLEQTAYQALFVGRIAILLYKASAYHNKFSGVALDALYAGCPIVTTAQTWIGQTVTRFDAGVVVTDVEPVTVLAAVNQIIGNYPQYAANARQAAAVLQEEHHPQQTLDMIKQLSQSLE